MLQPPPDVSAEDVLPAYSRGEISRSPRPEPVQYISQLTNRNQRAWLSLKLNSRSRSSKSLPLYFKSDTITGSVDLNLESSETIQSIVIKLSGETVTPHGVIEFWKDSFIVWTPTRGNPGRQDSAELNGNHSFPIEYKLPSKCPGEADFDLPPSHPGAAKVVYTLGVIVQRGRFKPNNKLWTEWTHWPRARAGQPSPLRQVSYMEMAPLSGPESDPDGWHVLEPVILSGELFSAKSVDIECVMSVANPLEFPRNNVIPLWLTIESSDSQALDLIANPARPVVGLVQQDTWYSDRMSHGKETDIPVYNAGIDPTPSFRAKAGRYLKCLSTANWWVPIVEPGGSTKRVLEGEIHVSSDVTSSFEFSNGKLSYYVCLFPPECTGFTVHSRKKGAHKTQPIKIVSDVASGPRPHSYSPPGYEDNIKKAELAELNSHLATEWPWSGSWRS